MYSVKICDSTLKTLGKSNSSLTFKEKIEIAKKLSELSVDVIELPELTGDKTENVLIKTISACINKTTLSIPVGNSVSSVENAYSLISLAREKRLLINIPSSSVMMEYSAKKKPKAVLELLDLLAEKSLSLCEDVEVSFIDATRAEIDFLISAVKLAIGKGVKTISLIDMVGTFTSQDYISFIQKLYNGVPELKNVTLSVGCSDTFFVGVSNVLSAIECGAREVKQSFNLLDGLTSSDKVFLAIENVGTKKGYSSTVNKTVVKRISDTISNIVSSKGVGFVDDAKEEKSEINRGISLQELSKIIKLKGYDLSSDEIKIVKQEIERISEKKIVNTKELDVIIATSIMQVPQTYKLVSFSVNSSNLLNSTASIVLNKDGKELCGLSYGNGSVDAAFMALEVITGRHFELDDFELEAVTEGKEAMGQAIVRLRYNGKVYSGRGVSTDIIGASIRAYLNSLNKIVYEEKN